MLSNVVLAEPQAKLSSESVLAKYRGIGVSGYRGIGLSGHSRRGCVLIQIKQQSRLQFIYLRRKGRPRELRVQRIILVVCVALVPVTHDSGSGTGTGTGTQSRSDRSCVSVFVSTFKNAQVQERATEGARDELIRTCCRVRADTDPIATSASTLSPKPIQFGLHSEAAAKSSKRLRGPKVMSCCARTRKGH